MKKGLLAGILFLFWVFGNAQTLTVVNDEITTDTSNSPFPVVAKTEDAGLPSSAKQQKAVSLWFEAGNGYFTTAPVTNYKVRGKWNHSPLLLSTKLYDTTRDRVALPPTLVDVRQKGKSSNIGSTGITPTLNGKRLKLTANCRDIVPGDPMAFALTYQLPDLPDTANPHSKAGADTLYKLYFFYNNNRTFNPITNSNSTITGNGNQLSACRTHSVETIAYGSSLAKASINPNFSDNWVCFSIPKNQTAEKNIFISLSPFADLEIDKSGSVYAVLTDPKNEVIATDSIPNMRFAPAHDPNYLVQRPFCLKVPKKIYPFTYKVHFQNTGKGNAEEVKLIIQLPSGMDFNTLKITHALFAGVNYTNLVTVRKNPESNQVIAIFKHDAVSAHRLLFGTAASTAPATDPQTMGEIQFTINSTVNTDDKMESYADIFFRSVHPSDSTTIEGYEQPVRTNIGVTTYRTSCDCIGDCPVPCKEFLGLCCWWWIIILIGCLIILWLFLRRRKKRKEAERTN